MSGIVKSGSPIAILPEEKLTWGKRWILTFEGLNTALTVFGDMIVSVRKVEFFSVSLLASVFGMFLVSEIIFLLWLLVQAISPNVIK